MIEPFCQCDSNDAVHINTSVCYSQLYIDCKIVIICRFSHVTPFIVQRASLRTEVAVTPFF